MPHPVLEVLQEVAQAAPGPDLPLAEKLYYHAPDALLDEIPERYAVRRVAPAERARGELRPLISDPLRLRAFHVAGRMPVLDFMSRSETRQDLVALKHHLLYAHAVGFSDPIETIYDPRWGELELSEQARLELRRGRLTNLVTFVTEADQLLSSGAIVFVPRREAGGPSLDRETTRRIADDDEVKGAYEALSEDGKALLLGGIELAFNRPRGTLALDPEAFVLVAEAGIQACLAHAESAEAFDLYFPHRGFQAVFRALIEAAGGSVDAHPTHSLRCLTDLISLDLPRVAGMPAADLVRVREDSDAFTHWRICLGRGLTALYDEIDRNPDFTLNNVEASRMLNDTLREAAGAVKQEMARSRFWSRAKAGAMRFSLGVIVGGATAPVALTASAKAAAEVATGYLGGLKRRSTLSALARHFAVFEP